MDFERRGSRPEFLNDHDPSEGSQLPFQFGDDTPFQWNPANPFFGFAMNSLSFVAPPFERYMVTRAPGHAAHR